MFLLFFFNLDIDFEIMAKPPCDTPFYCLTPKPLYLVFNGLLSVAQNEMKAKPETKLRHTVSQ